MTEQRLLTLGAARLLADLLLLAVHGAKVGDDARESCPLGTQAGVPVQQIQVLARTQQREVLALAVDVDQVLADLLEDGRRHGPAVHPRHAAPAGPGDVAGQDQAAVLDLQAVLVERRFQLAEVLGGREIEHALDGRAAGAGPHEVRRDPAAEQRPHGVDDDRLAGAGLARHHVQTARPLDGQPVDDREVADG